MKPSIVLLLFVTPLAAHDPPQLALPQLTFIPLAPRLEPLPTVPRFSLGCGGTVRQWSFSQMMKGGLLDEKRVREPQDPARTLGEAFRTCTLVTLGLQGERVKSTSLVLPDGSTERRLFGLVVESLLPSDDNSDIYSLYFEPQSLDQATRMLDFTPDLSVTFCGPVAACVQFDLLRKLALVTTRDGWDFFLIDAVAERAFRRLIDECKSWPNQSLEPTTLLVTRRAFARHAPSKVVAHL